MAASAPTAALLERLQNTRRQSEALVAGLEPEDLGLQGMAEASPPKWHLGHTSWFFETFLLVPHLGGYAPADSRWGYLFNSYYDAIGARHPRPERGLLSRPTIGAVMAWRRQVDRGLEALLKQLDRRPESESAPLLALLELGLQHEQQHQELLLMDLLDGFSRNPLEPIAFAGADGPEDGYRRCRITGPIHWLSGPDGLVEIGHAGASFHFDNEAPRHRVWLDPYALANRLVRNDEYAAFIADGGYRRPELWLSEGWDAVERHHWQAPCYWRGSGPASAWEWEFSLAGRRPLHPEAPVRHLSWFEADAYARWAGGRLPSEAEWEAAIQQGSAIEQADGVLWQWTGSPYRPYPGFVPIAGAVGEYNGKFMSSQMVLRGSSFLTPDGHGRSTYRNFFAPASRWMAAGLRLARDVA